MPYDLLDPKKKKNIEEQFPPNRAFSHNIYDCVSLFFSRGGLESGFLANIKIIAKHQKS
jgi:hypothetical protein